MTIFGIDVKFLGSRSGQDFGACQGIHIPIIPGLPPDPDFEKSCCEGANRNKTPSGSGDWEGEK